MTADISFTAGPGPIQDSVAHNANAALTRLTRAMQVFGGKVVGRMLGARLKKEAKR
jgi:hypothetical protein